jgi:hypothetical protein
LNILHIDTGAEMRGGQHQVLLLVQLLLDRGHKVRLLCRKGSPLYEKAFEARLEPKPAELLNVYHISRQSDIVHAHDARGHTLAALASRRLFVVSRRVAFPIRRSLTSRWKYKRPARYLAVSKFVASMLRASGIPCDRIDVVYDAVPEGAPGIWDPAAPAIALRSNDALKGRAIVEQAGKAAGLEVLFSDNLPRDFRRASMFAYITESEGLGSAALLAMRMGIPVVASRVGGLAEVFEDEISGLYTANEPAAVASSMRRIIDANGLAYSLVAAAKERVDRQFSPQQLIECTLASYRKALHG